MKKTKVYIAKTDVLFCDDLYEKLFRSVSKERQEKTERLLLRKDKNMSLGAELLLKFALKAEETENFQIEYGEHSKPYIKDRDDIFFNLSHSEGIVMCVVSDGEVGCDVEKVRDINIDTAKRFFSPFEYEEIMKKETYEERKDTFFRLWTLKESFLKATGMGLGLPLKSFSIDISEDIIKIEQKVNSKKYYFKEYNMQDGYKYAVCGLTENFGKAEVVDICKS